MAPGVFPHPAQTFRPRVIYTVPPWETVVVHSGQGRQFMYPPPPPPPTIFTPGDEDQRVFVTMAPKPAPNPRPPTRPKPPGPQPAKRVTLLREATVLRPASPAPGSTVLREVPVYAPVVPPVYGTDGLRTV